MKKIIVLVLLSIALSSCINNDMDDMKGMEMNEKMEMNEETNVDWNNNSVQEVELTQEDEKILEELLGN